MSVSAVRSRHQVRRHSQTCPPPGGRTPDDISVAPSSAVCEFTAEEHARVQYEIENRARHFWRDALAPPDRGPIFPANSWAEGTR